MPTYFLIGRDGTILAANKEIRADKDALRKLVEKHLGLGSPATAEPR